MFRAFERGTKIAQCVAIYDSAATRSRRRGTLRSRDRDQTPRKILQCPRNSQVSFVEWPRWGTTLVWTESEKRPFRGFSARGFATAPVSTTSTSDFCTRGAGVEQDLSGGINEPNE